MAKRATFTVQGVLPFPLDMLRYDKCWPAGIEDVTAMNDSFEARDRQRFKVTLETDGVTTPDRWLSFGWRIVV